MSATAQRIAYVYGKKREGAKENTVSREVFFEMIKSAEKFMPKDKGNEPDRINKHNL